MADKTSVVITKLSTEIYRLQNELLEATEVLRQRREIIEIQCRRCRELFKPWPQRMNYPGSLTNLQLNNTTEQEQAPMQPPNPDKEKEEQELAMLDNILAKAQQAREIQTKLSKPTKKSRSFLKCGSSSGSKEVQTASQPAVKETKQKPKVTYPVVTRPSTAKSTYAASYKKIAKTKQASSGTKRAPLPGRLSQARPVSKLPGEEKISSKAQPSNQMSTISSEKTSSLVPDKRLEKSSKSCKNENQAKTQESKDLNPSTESESESKRFVLTEKGSSLTMPPQFVKICKEHRNLLRSVRKVSSSSFESCGGKFLARLEGSLCQEISGSSTKTLNERLDGLMKDYKRLLSLARSTALTLHCIDEDTDLQKISRAVTAWQFITSKYQELNDEVQRVIKSLERLRDYCPCFECGSNSTTFLLDKDMKLCVPRPELVSGLTCLKTRADVWHPLHNDEFFTYQNTKELKSLQKLCHDYENAKHQLELRILVGEKILPLLRELPNNHRLFVSLFRTVYSILCCGGRTFPTMVQDVVPEDELL